MKELMLDMLKLGLGAADMTREQAEKLVENAREKYKDEIGDGREMVELLMKQAEENSERLRRQIRTEVAVAVREQKLVDESDLKELAANVKELAQTTAKISKKLGAKGAKAAVRKAKVVVKKKMKKTATKPKKTSKAGRKRKRR